MKVRSKKKKWLLLIASIGAVLACILLPGALVRSQAERKKQTVWQTYGSDYLNAELQTDELSLYERMKLISGEWDSSMQLIEDQTQSSDAAQTSVKCNLDAQTAVQQAEEGLHALYEAGLYPEDAVSEYRSWYRPSAELYLCTDTVFHSYSCYVWLVRLEGYDGKKTHTVLIDDTSGLILAGGVSGDTWQPKTEWQAQAESEAAAAIQAWLKQEGLVCQGAADISDAEIYYPQYTIWNTACGLQAWTDENSPTNYLISEKHVLHSYEEAVDEVRTLADNDKYLFSVSSTEHGYYFTVLPFTVKVQAQTQIQK